MCIHSLDNQRGWTGDCPDSSHCLCGYFVERGPAFPQPRRSTSTTSTVARQSILGTVAWIAAGVVAVVLALVTLGVMVIGTSDDDERRPHRYN
jgi:hypothetical protein